MKTQTILKLVKSHDLPSQPISDTSSPSATVQAKRFNVWFNGAHILKDLDFQLPPKKITCIIGPSGGGKSTLIRSINRINDDVEGFKHQGKLLFNNKNIYEPGIDVAQLRQKIGMVFQKPCVFPQSIVDNVLFGLPTRPTIQKEKIEVSQPYLNNVFLWKEVAHRLEDKADTLSIGQQQRLCIARSLAVKPALILLDEPTAALDPISAQSIEQLMLNLKQDLSVLFVTHNIQQAKRIADRIIFMCDGNIIEQGEKEKIFSCPDNPQTKRYLDSQLCDC